MAEATPKNRQRILANDRIIIRTQEKILRNQDRLTLLLRNQAKQASARVNLPDTTDAY
jgi:hypothetical protein